MWINTKIRLAKDTKLIKTKTGTPMRTAFGFAEITNGESGFPLGLVAFNEMAEGLAKYHAKDMLMISGNLQANNCTNKQGEEITGWQVVIDSIAGVKKQGPARQQPRQKSNPKAFGAETAKPRNSDKLKIFSGLEYYF